jgi:hypothetical protein
MGVEWVVGIAISSKSLVTSEANSPLCQNSSNRMECRFGLGLAVEEQSMVHALPWPFVQPTVAVADAPYRDAIHAFAVCLHDFHDLSINCRLLFEDLIRAAIDIRVLLDRLLAGFRIPML